MPTTIQGLTGIPETLLIPLYLRAMESQRPDALIRDERAVALIQKMTDERLYDFRRMASLHLNAANKIVMILRSRQFDRFAEDFLNRHPQSVVVHIGCGLDTRCERVDNRQAEWFDLDLPDVIGLRRQLIGGDRAHYHLVSGSVLEDAWLAQVESFRGRPFLFLAEGLFMYFTEAQVRSLVFKMCERFSGAELVFDAYGPTSALRHNLQASGSKIYSRIRWSPWRGNDLERWADGIRLLDEWGYLDAPDHRLDYLRWARPFDSVFRTMRLYRFQLGNPEA